MGSGPDPTPYRRHVAAQIVELLSESDEWLTIHEIAVKVGTSFPTTNRALRWLRALGAPLSRSNRGLRLGDRTWQLPPGERPEARGVVIVEVEKVVERVVEKIVERDVDVADWLTAATTGDLVEELEGRGYEVRISKVCKPAKARGSDERPSLLVLGRDRPACAG